MDKALCAVASCPAFAAPRSRYCQGHVTCRRLLAVLKGSPCRKCKRLLKAGDYVTRESTPERLVHAQCPEPEPLHPRKGQMPTPLFDEPES